MKIENQVLTIEQAKHLQDLGLDMSDAAFTWHTNLYTKDTHLGTGYLGRKRSVYTYTLQEMLNKLPRICVDSAGYNVKLIPSIPAIQYDTVDPVKKTRLVCYTGHNSLEATYKMLCWVVENGYLKEDNK